MNPERYKQVKRIFAAAIECSTGERDIFVSTACAGDEDLRSEVQSLLDHDKPAASFIEESVFDVTARLLADKESLSIKRQRIGPYKILNEIGRGGMGVVYLAARDDEHFRKRVAIKVVKRGLDTEDILRRFRNERQILASLDHPNIARLFDGGTTEDGLPYFVMEYIEGLPLLQYCDEQNLSTNERLRLFRSICAAVQHAHQNLVIHRDLKPSNILVTRDGEVKLLDFGVAKFLNRELMDEGLTQTRTGVRAMTPEYASPEQVRGQHLTTATDVYSLGVILYELLTGCRPYQLKDSSPEELSHAICLSDPQKPSEALSSRHEVGSRLLRGDIDNIVLKALRKEPARRYKAVEQLSADIERYIKGLPVIARKDTFAYRTSKFVQRHRMGVAAATTVALAIIAGLIGMGWQARAARAQRDLANAERLKAEAVNDFLQRTLNYSNPMINKLGKNSNEVTIGDALDEAARRLDGEEFASQPEVKAELERIIGVSYQFQGRYDLAENHLQKYIDLQARLYSADSPHRLLAEHYRASILFWRADMAGAEEVYRRILPRLREEYSSGRIKAQFLAEGLSNFAYVRRTQGDSKEAEALFRDVLELIPQIPPEWRFWVGLARSTLASTIADQGRFDEALHTSAQAVDEYRRNGETRVPDYGYALNVYGGFLVEKGDYESAGAALKEGEAVIRKTLNASHLWLGDNLRNQAILMYDQGRYDEAFHKASEALKIYSSFGKHYDHYPTVLVLQGLILSRTGKPSEGEKLIREAVQIRTETLRPDHYFIALAKSALGECLMIERRYDEAERLLRESYQSLKDSQGNDNPRTQLAHRRLLALYQKQFVNTASPVK